MSEKHKFTVSNSQWIFKLCMLVVVVMIIMNVLFTLFTEPPHLAMYIVTFLFIVLPVSLSAMWIRFYKVTVAGSQITVRRATGLKYSFDIFEVKCVIWRKNLIKMMAPGEPSGTARVGVQVIRVYTMSGKRFSIETSMNGFDQMSEYITETVAPAKIQFIERSWGK